MKKWQKLQLMVQENTYAELKSQIKQVREYSDEFWTIKRKMHESYESMWRLRKKIYA
jgi:hypothetical protein